MASFSYSGKRAVPLLPGGLRYGHFFQMWPEPHHFNAKGTEAGTASCCSSVSGSGSAKMMRLLADLAPALQQCQN
jgi:hypothetical protein